MGSHVWMAKAYLTWCYPDPKATGVKTVLQHVKAFEHADQTYGVNVTRHSNMQRLLQSTSPPISNLCTIQVNCIRKLSNLHEKEMETVYATWLFLKDLHQSLNLLREKQGSANMTWKRIWANTGIDIGFSDNVSHNVSQNVSHKPLPCSTWWCPFLPPSHCHLRLIATKPALSDSCCIL